MTAALAPCRRCPYKTTCTRKFEENRPTKIACDSLQDCQTAMGSRAWLHTRVTGLNIKNFCHCNCNCMEALTGGLLCGRPRPSAQFPRHALGSFLEAGLCQDPLQRFRETLRADVLMVHAHSKALHRAAARTSSSVDQPHPEILLLISLSPESS